MTHAYTSQERSQVRTAFALIHVHNGLISSMSSVVKTELPMNPSTPPPPTVRVLPPLGSDGSARVTNIGGNVQKRRSLTATTARVASSFSSTMAFSSTNQSLPRGKRGHVSSVSALNLSRSASSSLKRSNEAKRLRRSISWDVRPKVIHHSKDCPSHANIAFNTQNPEDCNCQGDTHMVSSANVHVEPTRQNDAWYSKDEYKSFLNEQARTVDIMQHLRKMGSNESELDPEIYCERGLENYESKELHGGIHTTRRMQKLLVIHEQARQSVLGMKDPEQIRLMATSQSERSSVKAQLRGALDQHEVEITVKGNGFASPLEALLADHKKSMMKEVIGELHKEQQDLYREQQQRDQKSFQYWQQQLLQQQLQQQQQGEHVALDSAKVPFFSNGPTFPTANEGNTAEVESNTILCHQPEDLRVQLQLQGMPLVTFLGNAETCSSLEQSTSSRLKTELLDASTAKSNVSLNKRMEIMSMNDDHQRTFCHQDQQPQSQQLPPMSNNTSPASGVAAAPFASVFHEHDQPFHFLAEPKSSRGQKTT